MYNKFYKHINEKIITIYPYQAKNNFMKSLVTCYNDKTPRCIHATANLRLAFVPSDSIDHGAHPLSLAWERVKI